MKKLYIVVFFMIINHFAFSQNDVNINLTYNGSNQDGKTLPLREDVSVGIPVFVGMESGSDCYINGHTFTFKLESLTEGAPMPANSSISIEAPAKPGVEGIEGYGPEDTSNPWRMDFPNGTWNYKITQMTDSATPLDSLDQGSWLVSIHIDSNSDPKWEFSFAQYTNSSITMDEDSFLIVKEIGSGQYETAATVEVDEYGKARLEIGGDEVNGQDDGNAFNTAVIKSRFAVDFTKNFSVIGTLTPQQSATPEGTLIGFIASTTEPTPDDLMGDSNLGIYYNDVFKNGIVLEFDSNPNTPYSTEPEYKHFGMMRINEVGFPKSTFQYNDMTECWPETACSYYIINDVTARTLTFRLRLPDNSVQTYVYTNPRIAFEDATSAYFIMSGVVRRGPSGSYGLGDIGSKSPSLEFFFDSFSYLGHKEGFEEEVGIFVNYLKHDWVYTADGDTLKARCTHDSNVPEESGCTQHGIKRLVITADDMNHNGHVYDKASYTIDEWTASGINVPALEYTGVGLTTYPKNTTAPSQCGTYTASASVENVTVSDGFMIRPSITYSSDPHCTATVTLGDGSVVPSGSFVDPYTTLTATATAEEDWYFSNWTKGNGGTFITAEPTFTLDISRDTLLHANIERDPYFIYLSDSTCSNEKYKKFGFDIGPFEPGMQYDTLHLTSIIYGCDSTVMLELKVNASFTVEIPDTICFGNGYHQHGFDLDSLHLEVGMNHDTLFWTTALGCDSIKVLSLFVAPQHDIELYDSICFGEDYHNYNFDTVNPAVGLYVMHQEHYSIFGCDSLVTLYLSVNEVFDTNFIDTTCAFAGYHEHGFDIDTLEPGTHFDTLFIQTVHGCDSIVTLELFVNPSYNFNYSDTICFGYGYHEHGFEIDSLGIGMYYDTLFLQTALGCDSTISVELYVAPVYDTTFFDTICFGNGYQGHGFEIDSTSLGVGMNYDTLYLWTVFGCDSTVMLELYVAPTYNIELFDTICFGEDYHGNGFDTVNPAAGMCIMQREFFTAIGCDSIITMNLLVGDVYDINLTDTTCVNEGYHGHGFEIDSLGLGWRYDTLFLSSVAGCDSTVMLELYVAPIFDTTFFDTICFGGGYYEHGFEIDSIGLEIGMNYDTLFLHTVFDCDSTVYLELYVAPTYHFNLFDSICEGEDYHSHIFDTVKPAAGTCVMSRRFLTQHGCDSIFTMHLFVGKTYDTLFTGTICYGEDYDEHNFHLKQPSVGLHKENQDLKSIHGCDSTVRLILYVAPLYERKVSESICDGEDYDNHGLHIPKPKPGTYHLTSNLESQYGCDSIFIITLNVFHVFDTPDTIHGMTEVYVTSGLLSGKYRYHIDTIQGCENYVWSLSNKDWVLTTDRNECEITVTTPGVGVLKVEAANYCSDVSQSIEIHAGYFGVGENEAVKASIYPNPSDGIVNVEADGIEVVNIIGATGAVVKSYKFERENLVSIDISDMPNSIYVLEIVTRDGRCIRRVIKDL